MFCNSVDGKSHDHAKWKKNKGEANRKRNASESGSSTQETKRSKKTSLQVRKPSERVNVMVTKYGLDHHQAVELDNMYAQGQGAGDSEPAPLDKYVAGAKILNGGYLLMR